MAKLEIALGQRLEQRLKLAPQIIQSMKILQLPALDLLDLLKQELEDNPVLELAEQKESEEKEVTQKTEEKDRPESEFNKIDELEGNEWKEYFSPKRTAKRSTADKDIKMEIISNVASPPISLQDYLIGQFNLLEKDFRTKELTKNIIFNIDNNGYLECPLEEILDSLEGEYTIKEANKALKMVQLLDPPGVGARNIKECLLLQLDRDKSPHRFERMLIQNHLEDIWRNKFPKIAKVTERSLKRIKKAVAFIATLHPKPGLLFGKKSTPFIVPDIIVERFDNRHEVIIEDSYLPKIYINRQLYQTTKDPEAKEFLKKKIEAAKWLITAIAQRQTTLYKIVTEIVKEQKDYFDKGSSYLKPLKMQKIAERVGVHVSTVSRAIADKYVQTCRGIKPLRFFFAAGTISSEGEKISRLSIKQAVKEIITKEDKRRPLHDDEIAQRLKEQGIDVARRTVAKYREGLSIPSSSLRKKY